MAISIAMQKTRKRARPFRGVITIKSNRKDVDIQGVGCRVFIALRILMFPESDLKAYAANDRHDEKTVRVHVEGQKKAVEEFAQILKEDLIKKFGNPVIGVTMREDPAVHIPPRGDFTQGLVLEQLGKGIDAQLHVLKKLDRGDESHELIMKRFEKSGDSQERILKRLERGDKKWERTLRRFETGDESHRQILKRIDKGIEAQKNLPREIAKAIKSTI